MATSQRKPKAKYSNVEHGPGFSSFHRNTRHLLLGLPIILLPLLSGCGDGDEAEKASGFPAPVHACEVLKTPEIEEIMGGPVNTPQETHKDQETNRYWMSMCIYYSEQNQAGMGISILPHGRNSTGAEAFSEYEGELKETLGNEYKQEVIDGVGEYAGWDVSAKQLTVFQGPYMTIFGVNSPKLPGTEALEMARRAAQLFLSKLQ